jgi:hypothetical protein
MRSFTHLPLQILDPCNHGVNALDCILVVHPSAILRPFGKVIGCRLHGGEILLNVSLGGTKDLPVVLIRNL